MLTEIARFYNEGGRLIIVNSLTWIVAIAIVIDRLIALSLRYRTDSRALMNQVQSLVKAGQVEKAIQLCDSLPNAAVGRVLKAGLLQVGRSVDEVYQAMEESKMEVLPEIAKRTGSLWTIANLATLIGLLGTIFGLITSFDAMRLATAEQKTAILSMGISHAMNNTAYGLVIAIFCMFFHMVLSSMKNTMAQEIERCSMRLENLLSTSNPAQSAHVAK